MLRNPPIQEMKTVSGCDVRETVLCLLVNIQATLLIRKPADEPGDKINKAKNNGAPE